MVLEGNPVSRCHRQKYCTTNPKHQTLKYWSFLKQNGQSVSSFKSNRKTENNKAFEPNLLFPHTFWPKWSDTCKSVFSVSLCPSYCWHTPFPRALQTPPALHGAWNALGPAILPSKRRRLKSRDQSYPSTLTRWEAYIGHLGENFWLNPVDYWFMICSSKMFALFKKVFKALWWQLSKTYFKHRHKMDLADLSMTEFLLPKPNKHQNMTPNHHCCFSITLLHHCKRG